MLHGTGFSFVTTIFLIYYYSSHIIKFKGRKQNTKGNIKWKRSQPLYAKQRERKPQEGKKIPIVIVGEEKEQEERDPERCVSWD